MPLHYFSQNNESSQIYSGIRHRNCFAGNNQNALHRKHKMKRFLDKDSRVDLIFGAKPMHFRTTKHLFS